MYLLKESTSILHYWGSCDSFDIQWPNIRIVDKSSSHDDLCEYFQSTLHT